VRVGDMVLEEEMFEWSTNKVVIIVAQ